MFTLHYVILTEDNQYWIPFSIITFDGWRTIDIYTSVQSLDIKYYELNVNQNQ